MVHDNSTTWKQGRNTWGINERAQVHRCTNMQEGTSLYTSIPVFGVTCFFTSMQHTHSCMHTQANKHLSFRMQMFKKHTQAFMLRHAEYWQELAVGEHVFAAEEEEEGVSGDGQLIKQIQKSITRKSTTSDRPQTIKQLGINNKYNHMRGIMLALGIGAFVACWDAHFLDIPCTAVQLLLLLGVSVNAQLFSPPAPEAAPSGVGLSIAEDRQELMQGSSSIPGSARIILKRAKYKH
eukprot:631642-Pelagomonas_calceolata.AAC.5